jgi:hypothetical protein
MSRFTMQPDEADLIVRRLLIKGFTRDQVRVWLEGQYWGEASHVQIWRAFDRAQQSGPSGRRGE